MSNGREFRRKVGVPVLIAVIGLIAFSNTASNPRSQAYYAVDVVRLIASGMCFGVALSALVTFFRGPRSD